MRQWRRGKRIGTYELIRTAMGMPQGAPPWALPLIFLGYLLVNEVSEVKWRRSSKCEGGSCVEVARVEDGVLVRDSKNPDVELTFTGAEWRAFIAGVRAGELG